MSRRREAGRGLRRYGPANLGHFAVTQLVIGVGLLMIWPFAFGALVEEVTATGRAARGEGTPGTFTAQSETCGKRGCTWYGTFTTGGLFQFAIEGVELRGDGVSAPGS